MKNVHFAALDVKNYEKICRFKFLPYLCNPVRGKSSAEIAQLVEHDLAKVGVASSSLVFRSKTKRQPLWLAFLFYEETDGSMQKPGSFTHFGCAASGKDSSNKPSNRDKLRFIGLDTK